MKPRLRCVDRLWYCGCTTGTRFMWSPVGLGYTPKEAYEDWRQQAGAWR